MRAVHFSSWVGSWQGLYYSTSISCRSYKIHYKPFDVFVKQLDILNSLHLRKVEKKFTMKRREYQASNRLTAIINRVILSFMNTKNITPEGYEEIKSKEEEARQARDQKIREMRASDPDYWTFERLAKHWKTKKQNIDYIINGDPRKR